MTLGFTNSLHSLNRRTKPSYEFPSVTAGFPLAKGYEPAASSSITIRVMPRPKIFLIITPPLHWNRLFWQRPPRAKFYFPDYMHFVMLCLGHVFRPAHRPASGEF